MNSEIKTPETHPDHCTIGHFFRGYTGARYYCDSYDPRIGFWMTNLDEPGNRINVSERAIGRTFHEIYSDVQIEEAREALAKLPV